MNNSQKCWNGGMCKPMLNLDYKHLARICSVRAREDTYNNAICLTRMFYCIIQYRYCMLQNADRTGRGTTTCSTRDRSKAFDIQYS